MVLRYDEQQLIEGLSRLPDRHRVAFAASCAERLLPAYFAFSRRTGQGDPRRLAGILDQLWRDLEGERMSIEQVHKNIDLCLSLIPQENDGPWVAEQAAAEDAAAALAYALRCRQNGQPQEAAWAARRAYEALDHFVIDRVEIDTSARRGEERVLSHPLVQAELARQQRDLNELLEATERKVTGLMSRVRERAKVESGSIFGEGSQ